MSGPSSRHADLFELDEPTVRCPFSALDDLRNERVRYVPEISAFVVSGYAEATLVLADPDLFSSRNATGPRSATSLARRIQTGEVDLGNLLEVDQERLQLLARRRAATGSAPALITADPPDLERQRSLILPALSPERVLALEPHVSAVVDELIDGFVGQDEVELMRALCRPLPLRVIAKVLGLDEASSAKVGPWTEAFLLGVGTAEQSPRQMLEMFEQIVEFYDHFSERLSCAEGEPCDDLVGVLATSRTEEGGLSLPEKLQMLSQLMVAGDATTASLLGSVVIRLATTPGLEDQIRADLSRLPDLIEEVARLEAPSTGLFRLATRTTRLGGVDIPAGSYVFVSYHAANLDPQAFDAPQDIRFDRPASPQHLSFGRGVHACPGAGLARMEVRVALERLLARVRNIRLLVPVEAIPYTPSYAIRSPLEVPLAFQRQTASTAPESAAAAEHTPMLVEQERLIADRILEVVLRAPDGRDFPAWEPGAHVELLLPSGCTRQYSLCGSPDDRQRLTIAVLEEVDGRGGSAELHRVARAGAVLQVRPPRNNFQLQAAPRYLFLAGGIGITPILTMVEAVQRTGAEWTLVYGGRSPSTMAYLDRVGAYSGGTVELWPEDERGRPDLPALLAAQDADTLVYACGPTGMLDAVEAAHASVKGLQPLRIERFAASGPVDVTGGAFEVVLAKTGRTLVVEENKSILETIRAVLPRLSYSCEEGYCGECETGVLEGQPDHRDDFLDDDERAAGEAMMICVSRCRGPRLVLDL
jgi:cytochrome P450/ferredoxin-NADP reductase